MDSINLVVVLSIKVLNQFNVVRLYQALDEVGHIYNSSLILPKLTVDIDKKIRETESQLAIIS